jgi:uncharacterized oligopeptide transporter (OPT) family protein
VIAHTERDIPMKYMLIGLVLFTLPLLCAVPGDRRAAMERQHSDDPDHDRRRFPVCSVSAYMAGLVGSSNNPVSGITICTILFAALVLVMLLGRDSSSAGGRDHDRRGGLLRGVHRRRQPAGSEVRLHRRAPRRGSSR